MFILVVEDDPDIALVLRLMLEDRHVVTVAGDLEQGREAHRRGLRFDLVILDVMLPDGNGLDLCREIKTTYPAVPVVVLSAYSLPQIKREAEARGCCADALLPKPFDPDEVSRVVDRLLDRG